jgi:xylono-1,5-lactonase
MRDDSPKCVTDCQAVLGEGPIWVASEQALYWLDIRGYRIFRRSNEGAITGWQTPFRICSLAPRAVGGFVAGTENGFALVDPAEDIYELIGDPEPDRATNRFNDGKVDREGRFWAGTMDDAEEQASGALYRLDQDRGWSRLDDGYQVSNGPAFSPDGRILYHNDSGRGTTFAFDVAEDGRLANKRVFARFEAADGYPDGMTVDAEGCLWIAFWDGWCVRRLSSEGEVLRVVELPVERPTSCAFGGPELDQLFITSARVGLNAEALAAQPNAGGLFMTRPGVIGIEERPFSG